VFGIFTIGGAKFIQRLPANQPIQIMSAKISQSQLWMAYVVLSIILFFLSGVTSTILYVFGTCSFLVCLHAGFVDKPVEAEFGDDQDTIV
jgi:hypothetical protein